MRKFDRPWTDTEYGKANVSSSFFTMDDYFVPETLCHL